MTNTLYDESGNPFEVMTDEEIANLQAKASKADELEKEKALINWRNVRAELKKSGKDMDSEGNIIDRASEEAERIRSEARAEVSKQFMQERLAEQLNKFDPETRPVVQKYFEKLTTGEEVNASNMSAFLDDAARLAIPNNTNNQMNRVASSYGQPPLNETGKDDFADSDSGKGLASMMGISLAPKKD